MRKLYMKFLWAYKTTGRCRSHRRRCRSSRAAATGRRRWRWSNGIGIPCVYLTGTEQTDQDIVGHAMTGYAEFSRDNAAGHASVCVCVYACVCMCVCLLVRLSLCLFVWPPASRNMRIGNYERYRCQLPASNEGRQREREGCELETETDVRSSLWAELSSFLLATFGIAHTPRVLPICNVACLSGPTAMALPHSMPHALCPMPSLRPCCCSCSCSMLVMSFIALHFCRLMPLACLSVFRATKLCAD